MRKPFMTKDGALRVTYRMGGDRKTIHLGKESTMAFAYEVQETAETLARHWEKRETIPDVLMYKLKRYPVRIQETFRRQGLFDFMKTKVLTLGEMIEEHAKVSQTPDMERHHKDAFKFMSEYFSSHLISWVYTLLHLKFR